jgi:hypothetical protein
MYYFTHQEPDQEDVHGFKTTHHTNRIEFCVDDDASVDELCDSFQHFLLANGYQLEGDIEVVKKSAKIYDFGMSPYNIIVKSKDD